MGGDCSQKLLLRRGIHSSPGRSRSSDQYEINNSIAQIRCPPTRLWRSLFPASGVCGCESSAASVSLTSLLLKPVIASRAPSHRHSALATWSPLDRQNGSLPRRH